MSLYVISSLAYSGDPNVTECRKLDGSVRLSRKTVTPCYVTILGFRANISREFDPDVITWTAPNRCSAAAIASLPIRNRHDRHNLSGASLAHITKLAKLHLVPYVDEASRQAVIC